MKSGLASGVTLAARYRVDDALTEIGARAGFIGTDLEAGTRVVLFPLTPGEAEAMRPIVGLEHAHLSRVLAVENDATGVPVIVVEHVPGPTLREVLRQVHHETPVEAVRSALRVADAVGAIHHAGGVHGCIRPEALIVAPEGHAPPRLTFVPPLEGQQPYRSRVRGDGDPAVADDAWAIAALLYEMLLGNPPPQSGVLGEQDLVEAGLTDPDLREVLRHGLAADEAKRNQDVPTLKRELASWFIDNATDESSLHPRASNPPPLPPGSIRRAAPATPAPTLSKPAPVAAPKRTHLVPVLAGVGFVLSVVGVWAYMALGRSHVTVVQVAKPSPSVVPSGAAEPSIQLNAVSVMGEHDAGLGDQMATCVSGWLPKGAFGKPPDLEWVCSQPDPREGAAKIRAALVANRPAGDITVAMKVWSRLGWYEMAAYGVIYTGCCADLAPLKLPDPGAGCARLDEQLTLLGTAVVAGHPTPEPLTAFEAAATCEAKGNRTSVYRQKAAPTSAERAAFEEYLKSIQSP